MDSFTRLPEGCISEILSFTSPTDASRSSMVSKEFKSAAGNDCVWEKYLPSDYHEIISTSVYPLKYGTKKQLFLSLCDSPLLINGGKMSFSLNKRSGKKCFMVAARELLISWKTCWDFVPNPKSRFSEVAKLRSIGWIHIQGKIETQMLSKNTTYAAHLVFWLERMDGLKSSRTLVRFLSYDRPRNNAINDHFETGKIAKMRDDRWLEIEIGKFYSGGGDGGEVEAWLIEVNSADHGKSGLIVEGIEFRPLF